MAKNQEGKFSSDNLSYVFKIIFFQEIIYIKTKINEIL